MSASAEAGAAAAVAEAADEKPAKSSRKRAKDTNSAREKAFHTWARGKKAARALCWHRVRGADGQLPGHEEDRRIAAAAEEMFRETEAYADAARRRREWALQHKCVVCHPPCDAADGRKQAASKQRARKRARADSLADGAGGFGADFPDTVAASAVNADMANVFLDDFSIVTGNELCARDHEGPCVRDVQPSSLEAQCCTLTEVLAQFLGDRAGPVAALISLACARAWTGTAEAVMWWCDTSFRKAMDEWQIWLTQVHASAIARTLVDVVGTTEEDADAAQHATLLRLIGPFCGEHRPPHAASLYSTFKVLTQHVCVPLQRLVVAMTTDCVCGKTYPHVSEVPPRILNNGTGNNCDGRVEVDAALPLPGTLRYNVDEDAVQVCIASDAWRNLALAPVN